MTENWYAKRYGWCTMPVANWRIGSAAYALSDNLYSPT